MTTLKENWNLFRSQLNGIKETANGIEARCPAHEDNHASLTGLLQRRENPDQLPRGLRLRADR